MNEFLFTIIVPIYNVEKYLRECIDSILFQTNKNFELILVDDGSKDNCGQICDEYALLYKNIRVIHKHNGGVTSARKEGLKIANGKYIIYIDADDYLDKNHIQNFYGIILDFDPDIICCGLTLAFSNKKIIKPITLKNGFFSKKEIKDYIYPFLIEDKNSNYFPSSLCTKAIKKDLLREVLLSVDDKIQIGEDKITTIGCIYSANSLYISEYTSYYYRYNENSVTKGKNIYNWREQLLIRKYLTSILSNNDYNFTDQINRTIIHGLFISIISNFNKNERYSTISNDIKNILKCKECRYIIKNAEFAFFSKGNLVKVGLKYRLIFAMYLYYKLNNYREKKC